MTTMQQVEAAAKRLGTTGAVSWGVGFQRNLDKLKLAGQDMAAVQNSWIAMHDSIKQRNLKGALAKSEISNWKTQTLSHLAQARVGFSQQLGAIEKRAKSHGMRMRDYLKPALVMAGTYTLPYFGGMLGREALTASSERRREIFRQQTANIPSRAQDKIFDQAEALSIRYPSVPVTAAMEMARNAYTLMGDAERTNAVLEKMVQSFVALQSAKGAEAAVSQLVGLLRGLDNLGLNKGGQLGIDQVTGLIEAATKAAQVDPDFDAGAFFPFARRTKVAGPALSPDFLARASVYMQDMGPDTAGNALAMAFKAFVLEAVGSAGGKRYLAERNRIGIRGEHGLVDKEMFGANPDQWVLKYLIPALKKDGVDLSNDTAVAAAVGKLSGNTNATAFLTRIVTQREQIARWLSLMESAMGTDAADKARFNDPFVAWGGFKGALSNLSASLVPIDGIAAGLNKLADGINSLASVAQENPLLTSLGIGAAGYGTWKGGKWAVGKAADAFGLKSSALALDGSAAALTRAAVALGGSGVVDGGVAGGAAGKATKAGGGWASIGKSTALVAARLSLPVALTAAGYASSQEKKSQAWHDPRGYLAQFGKTPRNPVEEDFFREAAQRIADGMAPARAREGLDQKLHMYRTDPEMQRRLSEAYVGQEFGRAARRAAYDRLERLHFGNAMYGKAPVPMNKPGVLSDPFVGVPTSSYSAMNAPRMWHMLANAPSAKPSVDMADVETAKSEAVSAGSEMQQALGITATPKVDTTSIDNAISKARQLNTALGQAAAAASRAEANVGVQLRRSLSD
ncbi:MAG: hypothetical protein C0606_11150 [Hyphomicrobiales bacterium]|nr:MAG: hypothetical protein C0606_11150 [Hyphomicrobiales bacterium]